MDSQWWLSDRKPDCPDADGWKQDLTHLLSTATNPQDTMVVTHHPIATHGTHGGFHDWKTHLFPLTDLKPSLYIPLPVIGSLYPLMREYLHRSDQDLIGAKNIEMREQWSEVYRNNLPFIHASGHDHNLQVLSGNDQPTDTRPLISPKHLLVSGAGSINKVTRVSHGEDTRFAHAHGGFMVVDYYADMDKMQADSVLLRVVEPQTDHDNGVTVYSEWLRGGALK